MPARIRPLCAGRGGRRERQLAASCPSGTWTSRTTAGRTAAAAAGRRRWLAAAGGGGEGTGGVTRRAVLRVSTVAGDSGGDMVMMAERLPAVRMAHGTWHAGDAAWRVASRSQPGGRQLPDTGRSGEPGPRPRQRPRQRRGRGREAAVPGGGRRPAHALPPDAGARPPPA